MLTFTCSDNTIEHMKTPTIAQVLHRAADEFLHDSIIRHYKQQSHNVSRKCVFSCIAIDKSVQAFRLEIGDCSDSRTWSYNTLEVIFQGLQELGLDVMSGTQFNSVQIKDRQQVRYAWLKFAAMIAEEQGV